MHITYLQRIHEGIIITYELIANAEAKTCSRGHGKHLEVFIPEPGGPICFCRLRLNAQ